MAEVIQMKGLRKHTHRNREKVVQEMIPLIKRKFGDNLVALATQASFARNQDFDYSDLELIAFVKKMPRGKKWDGMGKIRNGLLVELCWMTKETYIEQTKEVTRDWYLSASNRLLPIINAKLIREVNNYKVKDLKRKCLNQAAQYWPEVQESTAKVLNAIAKQNRDGIPLLIADMLRHMLIVLSFLNQTPYITFASFISQARKFHLKPTCFDHLADIVAQGKYQRLPSLRKAVTNTFCEFEQIFDALGYDLYDDNVDPNKPSKKFVG